MTSFAEFFARDKEWFFRAASRANRENRPLRLVRTSARPAFSGSTVPDFERPTEEYLAGVDCGVANGSNHRRSVIMERSASVLLMGIIVQDPRRFALLISGLRPPARQVEPDL